MPRLPKGDLQSDLLQGTQEGQRLHWKRGQVEVRGEEKFRICHGVGSVKTKAFVGLALLIMLMRMFEITSDALLLRI